MTGAWSSGADRGKGRGGEGAAAITSFPRTSQDRDPQAAPSLSRLGTMGNAGRVWGSGAESVPGQGKDWGGGTVCRHWHY